VISAHQATQARFSNRASHVHGALTVIRAAPYHPVRTPRFPAGTGI
jgi:hypothetical protein